MPIKITNSTLEKMLQAVLRIVPIFQQHQHIGNVRRHAIFDGSPNLTQRCRIGMRRHIGGVSKLAGLPLTTRP